MTGSRLVVRGDETNYRRLYRQQSLLGSRRDRAELGPRNARRARSLAHIYNCRSSATALTSHWIGNMKSFLLLAGTIALFVIGTALWMFAGISEKRWFDAAPSSIYVARIVGLFLSVAIFFWFLKVWRKTHSESIRQSWRRGPDDINELRRLSIMELDADLLTIAQAFKGLSNAAVKRATEHLMNPELYRAQSIRASLGSSPRVVTSGQRRVAVKGLDAPEAATYNPTDEARHRRSS